ncbi:conserved hypothetical protein [Flavobacterium sp. 9AF]|uniref:hypothetical protein n=1 Tax=Flavobacterium sp. 9AF TaxID=2653142 RepID=UPI0012F1DA33|nr:hypothetical protein [Flavobacterium sp. 9AF]VXC01508.1 conserved hypothetical protein [Flavobacterium sp. 9AF]
MHKKIGTSIIIIFIALSSCRSKNNIETGKNNIIKDSTLVYQDNKEIGKIGQKTTFNCMSCYAISKVKIVGKEIGIKIPVSNRGINNESFLEYDFVIDKIENNTNYTIVKYSSTLSSKAYELKLYKNEKGQIYVINVLTVSYGIKDIEIAENDYESFQSNSICQSKKRTLVKDTIMISDNNFFEKNECFDCPIKYTIDECIANKEKGIKMIWE